MDDTVVKVNTNIKHGAQSINCKSKEMPYGHNKREYPVSGSYFVKSVSFYADVHLIRCRAKSTPGLQYNVGVSLQCSI